MLGILIMVGILFAGLCALALLSQKLSKQANEAHAIRLRSLHEVPGFEPAIIHDGTLALDPKSKQFAIAIPGSKPRVYQFSQLIAAEVERDGETVTTTNGEVSMKGAAIATALVGPLGLMLGAKTSSTSYTASTVTKLSLQLYVNDLHAPCHEIYFFGGVGVGLPDDSQQVLDAGRELSAWYGRFRVILAMQERTGTIDRPLQAFAPTEPMPAPVQLGWLARTFGA